MLHSDATWCLLFSPLARGWERLGKPLQSRLITKVRGMCGKMIQGLDDFFLFYGKTEKDLMDEIETFLTICGEIDAEKSHLSAKKVQFCGRIVSSEGIEYHPRHFEAITTMAADLQQFICTANWMRNSIPEYAKRIAPLVIPPQRLGYRT